MMPSVLRQSDPSRWPLVDLRISERFPVELTVHYKVVDRRGAHPGVGKTVNMSSSGVLLTAEVPPVSGRRVELSISWPARLDGKCGLQLVASGRVIWCNGTRFAIRVDRHEFRTAGQRSLQPIPHYGQASTGHPELVHAPQAVVGPYNARRP